jgi:CheY-like chemotaxis protein
MLKVKAGKETVKLLAIFDHVSLCATYSPFSPFARVRPCRFNAAFVTNNGWRLRHSGIKSFISMPKTAAISRKHILVVDDEPFVCDAVKMMLDFDGHDVETAHSGKDALAMFEEGKFDLVITDFAMPAMKGDELAAAIKARAPKQPVVMITAYAEMLQSSGNPLKGVDFIISKPFLLENLREAIAKVSPSKPQKRGQDEK